MMIAVNRRKFAAGVALLPFLASHASAQASLPAMRVSKDPNCGCCGAWVDYLKVNGFSVDVVETADLNRIKTALGVPPVLWSCHTAEIGGYVIEGHVPADTIRRLLAERPAAIGLAVAGMPASAPGMDVPGASDAYEVVLFGPSVQKRYARYQGRREIVN
jgi:hypothetical protein